MTLIDRIEQFCGRTRVELDPDERIDVWSFRAVERLKVHEARTAAELESWAGTATKPLNLQQCRSARDVWRRKVA